MLEIKQMRFTYKRSKEDLFKDFSIQFEKGKIYGLLGKNGIGKSTLLYLLSGLLKPVEGTIVMDDVSVFARLPKTLQNLYILPEEFDLPAISLSAYMSRMSPFYPDFNVDQMESYLTQFEMGMDLKLKELSMGQKKKVLICFALATNSTYLLMDEPTNGLDIPGKSQFRKIVSMAMNENRSLIISTHQINDIDNLLDHFMMIDEKGILLNQSIAAIGETLSFVELENGKSTEGALYISPSLRGNSVLYANEGGNETQPNLELLFNALLNDPTKITVLFNTTK
jgi:ABC-2 type transport system ATP-binding protein